MHQGINVPSALTHPERGGRITIAVHTTRIIPPKTLRAILAQSGMSDDEFRRLL
jgi:hypothetical protein